MRVGKFSKVGYEQFAEAMRANDPLVNEEKIRALYDGIKLPRRSTTGSAGYDFFLPDRLVMVPGDSVTIPTGIKVYLDEGWWLGIFPRSGLGFKYKLQIYNTVGVIDADYINAKNEGHIFIKLYNDSKEGKTVDLDAGGAFAQGVFIPFGITYNDDADGTRNGGLGSTDAKEGIGREE